MAISLFLIVSIVSTCSQSLTECADSEECASSTRIRDNLIICSGYRSCEASTNIMLPLTPFNRLNGFIDCQGYQSCYRADNIKSPKDLFCSGSQSCAFSKATATNLYCNGMYSCRGGSARTYTASNLYCNGYYACNEGTMVAKKKLYCSAALGCAGSSTKTQLQVNSQVHCDGNSACRSTVIMGNRGIETGKPSTVFCRGAGSCEKAKIQEADQVCAYGQSALYLATLNSVGVVNGYGVESLKRVQINTDPTKTATLTVKAFGNNALINGHINCVDGMYCKLICQGNGCSRGKYNCAAGATCDIVPAGCLPDNSVANVNGVVCPTFTVLTATSKEDKDEVVGDDEDQDGVESEPISEGDGNLESDITECILESECAGQTVTDDSVWCKGKNSCVDAIVDSTGAYIICEGAGSCKRGRLESNQAIGCYGKESCVAADYFINNGKLSCTGERSCLDISLIDQPSSNGLGIQVSCDASESCRDSDINTHQYDTSGDRMGSIYCYGFRSCENSHVSPNYDAYSASCSGYESCKNATIETDDSVVGCGGSYSCENAVIGICHGCTASSYGAGMAGYYTAYNAKIIGVPRVSASGYYSISYATIDSHDLNSMEVIAYGANAGYGATVICRDGATCTLTCGVSGCDELNFVCLSGSTCSISPAGCQSGNKAKVDGVDCPNILTNIPKENEDEWLHEFLEEKEWERLNGEQYKMIQAEKADILDEILDDEEMELFGDVQVMNKENKYEMVWFVMVGIVVIIGVLLCVGYYNNKDKYYQELK